MSRKNRHAAMIEERAPLSTVSFPIDLQCTSAQISSHGAPNTRERGQLSGFTIISQSQLSRRSVAATVAAGFFKQNMKGWVSTKRHVMNKEILIFSGATICVAS